MRLAGFAKWALAATIVAGLSGCTEEPPPPLPTVQPTEPQPSPPNTRVAPPPPTTQLKTPMAYPPTAPVGDPAGTRCEEVVLGAGEQPADVFIRKGAAPCREASQTLQGYLMALQRGEGPGAGGRGPLQMGQWTCGTGPATAPFARCAKADGTEVEAVFW